MRKVLFMSSGESVSTPIDSDFQAWLDKGDGLGYTLPTSGNQTKINQLFTDLKSNGVWVEDDLEYIQVGTGSKEMATLNMKDPDSFQCTINGGVTWTDLDGFSFNGTTGYLDTGWDYINSAVKYTNADASGSIYISSVHDYATYGEGIFFGTGRKFSARSRMELRNPDTSITYHAHGDAIIVVNGEGNIDYTGFHSVIRANVTDNSKWYKDGVVKNEEDKTLLAFIDEGYTTLIGAMQGNGVVEGYISGSTKFFSIGSSQIAKQVIKNTLITNYVNSIT